MGDVFVGKCDECKRTTELSNWRNTHYILCITCALKWSKDQQIIERYLKTEDGDG